MWEEEQEEDSSRTDWKSVGRWRRARKLGGERDFRRRCHQGRQVSPKGLE